MSETLYGRCVESGSTFVIDNVAEVRYIHHFLFCMHIFGGAMIILQDMRYNPAVDTINSMC